MIRNEGIGDGNIKQKVVNIFVDLPALHSDMVVPLCWSPWSTAPILLLYLFIASGQTTDLLSHPSFFSEQLNCGWGHNSCTWPLQFWSPSMQCQTHCLTVLTEILPCTYTLCTNILSLLHRINKCYYHKPCTQFCLF